MIFIFLFPLFPHFCYHHFTISVHCKRFLISLFIVRLWIIFNSLFYQLVWSLLASSILSQVAEFLKAEQYSIMYLHIVFHPNVPVPMQESPFLHMINNSSNFYNFYNFHSNKFNIIMSLWFWFVFFWLVIFEHFLCRLFSWGEFLCLLFSWTI